MFVGFLRILRTYDECERDWYLLAWIQKEKKCFANLTALYDKMTGLVDERRGVDISQLDISKDQQDHFPYNVPMKKLMNVIWMNN